MAWAVPLALTFWMDPKFGDMAGFRTLYILPIWLVTWQAGVDIGILCALVFSALMYESDRSFLGINPEMALQNGATRFLALAVITLVIGHFEKLLKKARLLATRDPLTGVLNRAATQATVEQAIEGARFGGPELCFVFVDCDRLKEINDTRGHAFGDQVLSLLAKRLQSAVKNRGIVGRMGGDEFVALFEGMSEPSAIELMENAEQDFECDMRELGCETSMSFGLVPVGEEPVTFISLVAEADARMYSQKRASEVVFVPANRWQDATQGRPVYL